MGLFSTVHTWLYLAVPVYLASPDYARLYLALPGCTLACHELPLHRMPHTATDWSKCICIYIYRLNSYKGMVKRMVGWTGILGDSILRAPAVLVSNY